jgi:Protein of unknown function DUF262
MALDVDTKISAEAEKAAAATYDEASSAEPIPPTDIVAYNELRSCADLFRLFDTGKLEIQPDFQREVVWKPDDQSRFIDSLVKQLPIPSMCFSLDYRTQQWKVIDGLQRMSSIISLLKKDRWRLKNLDDIHPLLRGVTNDELRSGSPDQQRLYSTVLDVSIPITVIRCDYSQPSHMEYLFTIFHRLNSGGVRLNNQEIRNCIYSGEFNDLLKNFDAKNTNWNAVKKRVWGSTNRFRSIELLLRAISFANNLNKYDGNLARFLNVYMHEQSRSKDLDINSRSESLSNMASLARRALGTSGAGKVSLTFIEALLVGIMTNLPKLSDATDEKITNAFTDTLRRPSFRDAARYAITSEKNVKIRMESAISAFAGS